MKRSRQGRLRPLTAAERRRKAARNERRGRRRIENWPEHRARVHAERAIARRARASQRRDEMLQRTAEQAAKLLRAVR